MVFPLPCNLVEDAINQLLCKGDNKNVVEELQKLKHEIKVQDGWRTTYPNSKAYTHTQKPAMLRARLDPIYATEVIIRTVLEWDTEKPGIDTDHDLVSVKVTNPEAPYIGNGRWAMPRVQGRSYPAGHRSTRKVRSDERMDRGREPTDDLEGLQGRGKNDSPEPSEEGSTDEG